MPAAYLAPVSLALGATDGPAPVFAAAADAFQAEVGFRLLTVSRLDADADAGATMVRAWSSCPAVFPVGGRKPVDNANAAWAETIMRDRRPLVCDDPAALRRFFFDHADLAALDCGAGINLPVVLGGQVIGVVNVFHQAHWFTQERVSNAKAVLALMYPPLLLLRGRT